MHTPCIPDGGCSDRKQLAFGPQVKLTERLGGERNSALDTLAASFRRMNMAYASKARPVASFPM